MKISENDKNTAFAVLALAAIAVALYAIFLAEPADIAKPDIEAFVNTASLSPKIGLLMDARGADTDTARLIYQCGTNLASGALYGSHIVETYGCDDTGCISTSSAQNGSTKLTYEQAKKKLRDIPYIGVALGKPKTLFFEKHVEIYLDKSFNGSCKIG